MSIFARRLPSSFSITLKCCMSSGQSNVTATPGLSARPVLPMRWRPRRLQVWGGTGTGGHRPGGLLEGGNDRGWMRHLLTSVKRTSPANYRLNAPFCSYRGNPLPNLPELLGLSASTSTICQTGGQDDTGDLLPVLTEDLERLFARVNDRAFGADLFDIDCPASVRSLWGALSTPPPASNFRLGTVHAGKSATFARSFLDIGFKKSYFSAR